MSKITEVSDFVKIRPVGAELFHAERRTDRNDEVIVSFHNFTNAPKTEKDLIGYVKSDSSSV